MAEQESGIGAIAALGGKAAAANMTAEQRRQRAANAARSRWQQQGALAGIPRATHPGVIKIGEISIPCAVLEGGIRVLSETGVVTALGLYRSGAVRSREKDVADGGAQLPLYVANKNVKGFVDQELADVLKAPVWYYPDIGATKHKGVFAEHFPKICDVWLRARDAGVLYGKRQKIVAANADLLIRGLAHVGIVALVDEATGYQDERSQTALAEILEAFIAKELRKWVRTFDPEFYKQIFRLKGWQFSIGKGTKRPRVLGRITNDLVYRRLAPGVLEELKRKNPADDRGYRRKKHHQWLSDNVGHPALKEHLRALVVLMRATDEYESFYKMVERSLPKQIAGPTLFDFDNDDPAK